MERVREEVAALPGVAAAALGSGGPLFGGVETGGIAIAGRPAFAPSAMPTVQWFNVGATYFDTLGVRLLRGRRFAAADTANAPAVALINDTLARRFFAGEDPIGQRLTVQNHAAEVIGVVADVRPLRPDEPTLPPSLLAERSVPPWCGVHPGANGARCDGCREGDPRARRLGQTWHPAVILRHDRRATVQEPGQPALQPRADCVVRARRPCCWRSSACTASSPIRWPAARGSLASAWRSARRRVAS